MKANQLKIGLARILEYAKAQRDLADDPKESARWATVAHTAYEALGRPSMADLAGIVVDDLNDAVGAMLKAAMSKP